MRGAVPVSDCGGCRGEGGHKRFCPEVHGRVAWMRYRWSQQAENLADEVGANQPGRANILYQLAGFWRAEATEASEAWRSHHPEQSTPPNPPS